MRAEEEISERLKSKVEEKEVELERARRILNEAVKCSEEERVNARREFEELKERLVYMEESHEKDIRRFRDSLEEKEQEIVELRKTLAKSHGKERQSERAFSGWNLGGVHRDDLDAPYSQGNFVSREDFTRLLKVSETSILSKVQNMFEKEKSSEGLHRNIFLSTGRG